jgi:hypothetical protein
MRKPAAPTDGGAIVGYCSIGNATVVLLFASVVRAARSR